ncbi:hypothetical protein HN011_001979 [Eciton burchellii]|nr:hypothetical protein HN011_001979 [Eciton burchellii]
MHYGYHKIVTILEINSTKRGEENRNSGNNIRSSSIGSISSSINSINSNSNISNSNSNSNICHAAFAPEIDHLTIFLSAHLMLGVTRRGTYFLLCWASMRIGHAIVNCTS